MGTQLKQFLNCVFFLGKGWGKVFNSNASVTWRGYSNMVRASMKIKSEMSQAPPLIRDDNNPGRRPPRRNENRQRENVGDGRGCGGCLSFVLWNFSVLEANITNFRLNGRRPGGKNKLYCFDQMRARTQQCAITRVNDSRGIEFKRVGEGLHEIIVYIWHGRKLVFRLQRQCRAKELFI